jgi:hypothetical protein
LQSVLGPEEGIQVVSDASLLDAAE